MTQQSAEKISFEYCGIRCTEQSLVEIDGGKVMVNVPRQELKRVTLRHGIQSPHPVLQIVAGCIMIATGYFPAVYVIDWILHRESMSIHLSTLLIPMVAIGFWLVFSAFKRGHFLEVELKDEEKRLAFHGKLNSADLENFIAGIERSYDIRIAR